jgi:chromosome segregation ATPase
MDLATRCKQYKSPDYKLLPFFHNSRDDWKVKARDRNLRIKRLKNRVAALEDSRQKWREKARAHESRIVVLTQELEEQKGSPA